jgi:hypothetical protein
MGLRDLHKPTQFSSKPRRLQAAIACYFVRKRVRVYPGILARKAATFLLISNPRVRDVKNRRMARWARVAVFLSIMIYPEWEVTNKPIFGRFGGSARQAAAAVSQSGRFSPRDGLRDSSPLRQANLSLRSAWRRRTSAVSAVAEGQRQERGGVVSPSGRLSPGRRTSQRVPPVSASDGRAACGQRADLPAAPDRT